jgi:hypothetical protein
MIRWSTHFNVHLFNVTPFVSAPLNERKNDRLLSKAEAPIFIILNDVNKKTFEVKKINTVAEVKAWRHHQCAGGERTFILGRQLAFDYFDHVACGELCD